MSIKGFQIDTPGHKYTIHLPCELLEGQVCRLRYDQTTLEPTVQICKTLLKKKPDQKRLNVADLPDTAEWNDISLDDLSTEDARTLRSLGTAAILGLDKYFKKGPDLELPEGGPGTGKDRNDNRKPEDIADGEFAVLVRRKRGGGRRTLGQAFREATSLR
ncbi:hypothetical protein JCM11641_007564 [Rhodosporidiobolus odoratus]